MSQSTCLWPLAPPRVSTHMYFEIFLLYLPYYVMYYCRRERLKIAGSGNTAHVLKFFDCKFIFIYFIFIFIFIHIYFCNLLIISIFIWINKGSDDGSKLAIESSPMNKFQFILFIDSEYSVNPKNYYYICRVNTHRKFNFWYCCFLFT